MPLPSNLQGSSYARQMDEWATRNEDRIERTKKQSSSSSGASALAFSNIPFPSRPGAPLFEAIAAVAVPTKHYQPFSIDGAAQRLDWAHDSCRSIAFLDGGSLLLVSQAVAPQPDGDAFLHHCAVKLAKGDFAFEDKGNGKFSISANAQIEGTDLLTGAPARHAIAFSFQHNPTRMATMSSTSFRASSLASSVYGQHGGLAHASEESVITVAHLAPHPYLLAEFAAFGYKSRHEFQDDVSALLAAYLK
jgi:hypothetical protein